jgi:SAM-dependent methyltransferase
MTPAPGQAKDFSDIEPPRYSEPWREPFQHHIDTRLTPGITILDIGGGRDPAVAREQRPAGSTYIGLDPDAGELQAAPAGSYDRQIVASAETTVADLAGTVDLVVSWQVFEHVRSMDQALRNTYSYLRPGGTLVSLFSGRWSAFGVLNRIVPNRLGYPILERIAHRSAKNKPIFRAYYDACSATALRRLTAQWTSVEITPYYRGDTYFTFARPAMRAYLAYENAVHRRQVADAASHYLLVASR